MESIKNIGTHVANSGKDDLGRAEVQEKMLAEGWEKFSLNAYYEWPV